jgi:AmmeMemoRadiSam system protein A
MKDEKVGSKLPLASLVPDWLKGRAAAIAGSLRVKPARLTEAPHGAPAGGEITPARFSPDERTFLLNLARRALVERAGDLDAIVPVVKRTDVPPKLVELHGCFVTLTRLGELRGCIGQVLARAPLYQAVMDNACSAAWSDPRFEPVDPTEIAQVRIEISVLTEPHAVFGSTAEERMDFIKPQRDGVLLELDGRIATFLPQVWEQVPDKADFLNRLAQKAGYPPEAWREKQAVLSIYQAESFEEK